MTRSKLREWATVTAVFVILCAAIFVLFVGSNGEFPAIFGFEEGYVLVVGLQLLAALAMWLTEPKPNLPGITLSNDDT
ncbi:hypothetical protein [Haloplanus sp. C73]|uniref:hypothetical protein n=1 Tax=Haloplanus sp. C73 TaxID=3421641 RepID=UPI003EBEFA26